MWATGSGRGCLCWDEWAEEVIYYQDKTGTARVCISVHERTLKWGEIGLKQPAPSIRKVELVLAALTGRQPWILRRGRAVCALLLREDADSSFSCIGASSSKKRTLVTNIPLQTLLKTQFSNALLHIRESQFCWATYKIKTQKCEE